MKGVPHFFKNGKEHKGPVHKTKGVLMTGAKHTPSSRLLVHKNELSAAVRKKIKQRNTSCPKVKERMVKKQVVRQLNL